MQRTGLPEPVSEQAIAIVREQGYLDDARYARLLAADRREIDGWGVSRIRERLERAGVERELIDATLAEFDPATERVAAVELLRRRLPLAPANDRERQRAFGILIRHGFESEIAYDAIRELERSATAA
jgi:regulatory protein